MLRSIKITSNFIILKINMLPSVYQLKSQIIFGETWRGWVSLQSAPRDCNQVLATAVPCCSVIRVENLARKLWLIKIMNAAYHFSADFFIEFEQVKIPWSCAQQDQMEEQWRMIATKTKCRTNDPWWPESRTSIVDCKDLIWKNVRERNLIRNL